MLVFAVIFAIVAVAFTSILVSTLQVQSRQGSQAEVSGQSQFLLQQIQYYVERSSLIDIPQDTPTGTLKLWLGVNAQDPMFITLSGGTVYLRQTATGTLQALTSNKVTVSGLTFTRRANPPGHDAVSVAFTMAFNSANFKQAFSQIAQTTIARVSAATFDTGVYPSSTGEPLGTSGLLWSPINGVVYFSGSNVGIGVTPAANAPLEVAGGNVRVDAGDVYVFSNSYGLMLKDSSGVCWRVKISIAGALTSASTTCP